MKKHATIAVSVTLALIFTAAAVMSYNSLSGGGSASVSGQNAKASAAAEKKDLGPAVGLYPTPLVVVGTMVDGKPNWMLAGHNGNIGHDRIMLSLAKAHYTNRGIRETKAVSVNVVDEALLEKADYVGSVSGAKADKSQVFAYSLGENGAPLIDEAKVTMECSVVDIYETDKFDNFILSVSHTYAAADILNENGRIDYNKFKPVLFEMPNYTYLRTGDTIAKCLTLGKK